MSLSDLSGLEWLVLKRLLPIEPSMRGRRRHQNRAILNGTIWLRCGAMARRAGEVWQVAHEYVPRNRILYERFVLPSHPLNAFSFSDVDDLHTGPLQIGVCMISQADAKAMTSWKGNRMLIKKRLAGCFILLATSISHVLPASAATIIPQSWNGWRWTNNAALNLTVGNNVSSDWTKYLTGGAAAWSKNVNINFKTKAGATNASACGMVFGTVQACSGDYGATGWLGYASVITSGSTIVAATVKLNDFYFSQAKYNTFAFRSMIACQELGHTIGLAHIDTSNTNTNLGTCMDYSNDPSGKKGTNGTLTNVKPSVTDMAVLDQIYSSGTSASTPLRESGDGYYITDDHDHVAAVPETSTWITMLAGFFAIGSIVRRQRNFAGCQPL